jgi:hypothetical protein
VRDDLAALGPPAGQRLMLGNVVDGVALPFSRG